MTRRRIDTPPGVPVARVADPRTIALDYYEALITEAIATDRPSLRRLVADLFDEGHHHGVAAGRVERVRDLEAKLAEQRKLFDAAARAAELNRLQVDELEVELGNLRAEHIEPDVGAEPPEFIMRPHGDSATCDGELTYEADPEAA